MRLFKLLPVMIITGLFSNTVTAQNVGIAVSTPSEALQVDSTIKVGKDEAIISSTMPNRKNRVKFGDGNFLSIGEELVDDKMYIRYGDLIFLKSTGAAGSGYIGIGTETPSASLDLAGSLRIRNNGGAGKVLTSDANGVATWQALPAGNDMRNDTRTIGPASFMGREDVRVWKVGGNGGAYFNEAVNGLLYAPLQLPDSSLIYSITYNYVDNNAANNYSFGMGREHNEGNGFAGSPFTLTTSGASASFQSLTQTFTTPYLVRNDLYSFYISMIGNFSGTGDAFIKSVVVKYAYKVSN